MDRPMRSRPVALALLLAALAAAPARAEDAAPPPGAPCVPVKPCEIPDEPAVSVEPAADFAAEARRLFDLLSCRGAPPAGLDAGVVKAFCARQRPALSAYRGGEGARLPAFLAPLRPARLPGAVLYPFGGGDLLGALTAYPDARNITTASPAPAGDPRALDRLRDPARLRPSLDAVRTATAALLRGEQPMRPGSGRGRLGDLPGPLALALTSLAALGYEPVGLRFFRIEPAGTLRYLTASELAAGGKEPGDGAASAFASAELAFVRRGEDPRAPRYFRCLADDLSDPSLARTPGPLAHLASKGPLAVLARAAGDRLARPDFSRLRALLLERTAFMVSDAAGILPPSEARRAGLLQQAYGRCPPAAHPADPALEAERAALFAAARPLPARLGTGAAVVVARRQP
jgi:hypothetical protein